MDREFIDAVIAFEYLNCSQLIDAVSCPTNRVPPVTARLSLLIIIRSRASASHEWLSAEQQ